ncbi:heavy metal-associated domain containing protein [Musa troglodytarum]|uniref:Heavy metal-associated domain containing protein n=1 Tax=Musa troglodytarum TaxID=320322 RepID=A0A9E7K3W2_9LILI|nr:heavy metal-associated domain containing protein [Musa troglodytarum]
MQLLFLIIAVLVDTVVVRMKHEESKATEIAAVGVSLSLPLTLIKGTGGSLSTSHCWFPSLAGDLLLCCFVEEMKKIVVKVDVQDDKAKQKAMNAVSALQAQRGGVTPSGIDSIAMDMKERKMTVIGAVDPVHVVGKLRKCWPTAIVSVGPKEEPKKEEGEKKKECDKMIKELVDAYKAYNPCMTTRYCVQSAEENPDACVIL